MAQHIVKCLICGENFDINKEPFVKPNATRYAHQKCYEEREAGKTQEQKDIEALEIYIKKLLNINTISAKIKKQIKEYKEAYNYSYSGILKTLIWWYDIQGNSTEKANGGIGIVPYVYQDALQYYYALYLAQKANEDKNVNQYINKVREFIIELPRVDKPLPRLFNLGEDDEDE